MKSHDEFLEEVKEKTSIRAKTEDAFRNEMNPELFDTGEVRSKFGGRK